MRLTVRDLLRAKLWTWRSGCSDVEWCTSGRASWWLPVLLVVLAQVFLPSLAARRVRDRVARYGTVRSVSVSAFPAVKLLWGKADTVNVDAGTLVGAESRRSPRCCGKRVGSADDTSPPTPPR